MVPSFHLQSEADANRNFGKSLPMATFGPKREEEEKHSVVIINLASAKRDAAELRRISSPRRGTPRESRGTRGTSAPTRRISGGTTAHRRGQSIGIVDWGAWVVVGGAFVVFCETDSARSSVNFRDWVGVKKPWYAPAIRHGGATRRAAPDVDKAVPRIRRNKDPTSQYRYRAELGSPSEGAGRVIDSDRRGCTDRSAKSSQSEKFARCVIDREEIRSVAERPRLAN